SRPHIYPAVTPAPDGLPPRFLPPQISPPHDGAPDGSAAQRPCLWLPVPYREAFPEPKRVAYAAPESACRGVKLYAVDHGYRGAPLRAHRPAESDKDWRARPARPLSALKSMPVPPRSVGRAAANSLTPCPVQRRHPDAVQSRRASRRGQKRKQIFRAVQAVRLTSQPP